MIFEVLLLSCQQYHSCDVNMNDVKQMRLTLQANVVDFFPFHLFDTYDKVRPKGTLLLFFLFI